ncbi:MAG: transcription antitermination factor NusB [Steroidobacteraceae bacterium]|nr:transcription antitermination factor NusB [Steroidobacteraceae bacterium]MDW8258145.1 transcription antitermination factor NusB [Gammaproteobacteria bacterium]
MSAKRPFDRRSAARAVARRLALQALYRWQLNDSPWQDLVREFADEPDMAKADADYFRQLLAEVGSERVALDAELARWSEIPPAALDAVERAALWIGVNELRVHPELPGRVVINEAVQLAKRYGATDGYKFVNAVLDRAARALRPREFDG